MTRRKYTIPFRYRNSLKECHVMGSLGDLLVQFVMRLFFMGLPEIRFAR